MMRQDDNWQKGTIMADISIIIPCYNVEQYIDRCLTSIVSQTIGTNALEIICVDDASTDSTWAHLQAWEQKYPDNIILIHCDTNGRQGTARNIGMQYVSAPYVTFIDADDWIEPDYCEIMYDLAEECECDVVRCNMQRDYSQSLSYFQERKTDVPSQYLIADTIEKRKLLMSSHMLGHTACDKLIRTSLLINNQIFFAENMAYEEIPWHTLLHVYASKIFIVGNSLYHYFVNPASTTSNQNADYYTDSITASLLAWQNWKNHNLFTYFQAELEYNFIFYSYLYFLKNIISNYNPSYSLYLMVREIVLEHVPEYNLNPYIAECSDPIDQLLIASLAQPIDQHQFAQLNSLSKG